MKVRCINENSGLILNEIYRVVVIHSEGYELGNSTKGHDPNYFEIVEEDADEIFIQIWGMTPQEYFDTFGELPE